MEKSHWLFKGEVINDPPEKAIGFVYLITNLISNRKYIGRKYFGSKRRKPLTKKQKSAGRVRRDVIQKDSNWREYTSSSIKLNADIEKLGKENFKFEILIIAGTKGRVNYLEENIQHKCNVILSPDYYNDCIGSRKFMSVKFPEEKIQEISELKF